MHASICTVPTCLLQEVGPTAVVETRAAQCWRKGGPAQLLKDRAARAVPRATDPWSLEGPGLGWVSHGTPSR